MAGLLHERLQTIKAWGSDSKRTAPAVWPPARRNLFEHPPAQSCRSPDRSSPLSRSVVVSFDCAQDRNGKVAAQHDMLLREATRRPVGEVRLEFADGLPRAEGQRPMTRTVWWLGLHCTVPQAAAHPQPNRGSGAPQRPLLHATWLTWSRLETSQMLGRRVGEKTSWAIRAPRATGNPSWPKFARMTCSSPR
jgi:hypothetical protein